jgi:hypothetical protein
MGGIEMTDQTKPTESVTARRDRQATEAKSAWAEHDAHKEAVNSNMERLREERLAREAQAVAAVAAAKTPVKSVRSRKKPKPN